MKLVCGVGNNDVRESGGQTKFYQTWSSMLKRCYSSALHARYPTYIGCSVCDEWLTFSNFKAWMETQDWEGKQLDKDLLVSGNKVYSPDTCVFVSRELNMFLTERNSSRGEYPIGVSFDKEKNKFRAQCNIKGKVVNLGRFDNAEIAHEVWKKKKLELATVFANNETDQRIAKAIMKRYETYKS